MISFSQLGTHNHGRLGNQLFQIASTIGIAHHFNTVPDFPEWAYEKYFENALPSETGSAPHVKEQHFHFGFEQFNSNCDISGWLQSEKYFEACSENVREQFRFKFDFKKGLAIKYQVFDKPTIAISVRRGDYVNNSNYYLLPPSYYVGALVKHFPDYENYNVVIFSDDIPYCKIHFSCLPNVTFAEGSDIEQLCLASMCDHFIIANSTFSWWCAWLGEKQHSKVIKPNYHFGHMYGKVNDAKDYYPARWTAYDNLQELIDLSDVTFIIPVSYDHPDRKQNMYLSIRNLLDNFKCKIIVGEQGSDEFDSEGVGYQYKKFDFTKFHRTRMLNELTKLAGTKIVVNYDADVLIPPLQIYEAVKRIRAGVDFVYPYGGRFARVPRTYYEAVNSFNDVGVLKGIEFKGTKEGETLSFGGCVAYNRESFFNAGGENENFISWSGEDWERVYRFKELGYKVERVDGILYHIDHHVGVNSSTANPDYVSSMAELKKVQKLKGVDLRKYVSSWDWFNGVK